MLTEQELRLEGVKQGRPMVFRLIGECMYPTLRIGDRVVIIAPENNYRIGDIVSFTSGNDYIMHRIVARFNGQFLLKGDRAGFAVHLLSSQDLLGVAVLRERNGRIKSLDSSLCRIAGVFISLAFLLTGIFQIPPAILRWRKSS